jgi:hypothetical protein
VKRVAFILRSFPAKIKKEFDMARGGSGEKMQQGETPSTGSIKAESL